MRKVGIFTELTTEKSIDYNGRHLLIIINLGVKKRNLNLHQNGSISLMKRMGINSRMGYAKGITLF